MHPSPRSPSASLTLKITNESGSTNAVQDAKDLRQVVINLHGQLSQLLQEREYYSGRTSELESALAATAPEILDQSIAVKTLQMADMLLELDGLNAKVQEVTQQNVALTREAEKVNILFSEVKTLRSQNSCLRKEKNSGRSNIETLSSLRGQMDTMREENERLRNTLKEQQSSIDDLTQENEMLSSQFKKQRASSEESMALRCQVKSLQDENNRMRLELELERSVAEELACVKSTIESLSEENKKLRLEKNQTGLAEEINELKSKVTALTLDNQILRAEKDSMKNIRSQLDALNFENEKLRSQRDADRSVLEELNSAINSLKNESAVMLDNEEDEKQALRSQVKSLANEVLRLHKEKNAAEDAKEEKSRDFQSIEQDDEAPTHEEEEEETAVQPTEPLDALHQTIEKMKSKIEVLEEEKQKVTLQCSNNRETIESLTEQLEFKAARVEVLEEMLKANHQGQIPMAVPLKMNFKWATSKLQGGIKAVSKRIEDVAEMEQQRQITNARKEMYFPSKSETESLQPPAASVSGGKVRRMKIQVKGEPAIYAGPIVDGLPNGKGSIRFENGNTYLGDVVNGEMHGNGTLYHGSKSAAMSRGQFKHNVFVENKTISSSD